jgi:hypothetical protein
MRIKSSRLVLAAACAAAVFSSTAIGAGAFAATAQAADTALSSLDVVSAPVAAGNTAVVITLDESHSLQLTDVDPVSGTVMWRYPYSPSGVTPGVYLSPAVADGTVLDVAPTGKGANPNVTISGIDATTGAKQWSLRSAIVLSDNPAPCVGNQDFCLTGYNPDGSTDMLIVSAATGETQNLLSGPNRALGLNLYQSDASTPTFEQLTGTGTIGWTEAASAIFGPGYDPGQGWNITPVGSLDVGSIGATASGNTMNLAEYKTTGFSIVTGAAAWSIPGSYMCMGTLQFLSTQVACQYVGNIQQRKKPSLYPSMTGVTLKLVGFNATTGAIDWSQSVTGVKAMMFGNGLSFRDGTQLLVTLPGGKQALLNTSTGVTAPITHDATLWCQKLPIYKVPALKGAEGGGMRASAPVYFPCTPNGRSSSKSPASFPSTIGTFVNGAFVWSSPSGLQIHSVRVPKSSA